MDEDLLSRTRKAYDAVAASYARMLPDASYEDPTDLALIDRLVAGLPAGAAVLDAGCGTGRMLGHLASRDPSLRLVGVDLSPAMVTEARTSHPGVAVTVGELASLEYPDGAFDGVLAWYSIIHTPPSGLDAVFGEFRRVLRPGGLLLAGFQAGSGERSSARAYGHDIELRAFLHRTEDVAAVAESMGLRILTRQERVPRTTERHPQGFILASARIE